MNLDNYERIDKVLFKISNKDYIFTINNVLLLGKKNAAENKISSITSREYNSQKYSDHSTLKNMNIDVSEYISLKYYGYTDKVSYEVFASYPHLEDLLDFFNKCMDMLNTNSYYTSRNEVSRSGNEVTNSSAPLGANKVIHANPGCVDRGDILERAIYLILDGEGTAVVPIDGVALYTIIVRLSEFNLSTMSSLTLITALLYDNAGGGNASNSSYNNYKSSLPARNKPSNLNVKGRKPMTGSSSVSKTRRYNPVVSNDDEEVTDEGVDFKQINGDDPLFDSTIGNDESVEEPATPKRNTTKPSTKGKSTKGSKKSSNKPEYLNLENILEEADKVDFTADMVEDEE